MRIVVLGASGMLGAMVTDWLARDPAFQVRGTVRDISRAASLQACLPIEYQNLNAEQCDVPALVDLLRGADWAINAIGVIKPYIHDDNANEVERATRVNTLFPHLLARAAEQVNCRVLQIATDCVYAGQKGNYIETDAHDPLDVYGKTKSLGEVYSKHVYHLRCSIIGPEPSRHVSLLDWFLGQPRGAQVNGYQNHQWNGVTTLQFAKICAGILRAGMSLPHVHHLVPAGAITKSAMLEGFARAYQRADITISPMDAKIVIDRTLATQNTALNQQLWRAAGYAEIPTVPQMIGELAQFDYRFKGITS